MISECELECLFSSEQIVQLRVGHTVLRSQAMCRRGPRRLLRSSMCPGKSCAQSAIVRLESVAAVEVLVKPSVYWTRAQSASAVASAVSAWQLYSFSSDNLGSLTITPPLWSAKGLNRLMTLSDMSDPVMRNRCRVCTLLKHHVKSFVRISESSMSSTSRGGSERVIKIRNAIPDLTMLEAINTSTK